MTRTIRRATPDDASDLLGLIRDHAAFEHGVVSVSLGQLHALLSVPEPPSCIWVVAVEGLGGYAALTFDYALWSGERFGHLDCLFLRMEHRGRGIGAELFQTVANAARSAGAMRLEWQTPLWNEKALRFYTGLGAVSSRKHRFHMPLGG